MNATTTIYSKATPSDREHMVKIYTRILRGIHYRHEFARRNPKVIIECDKIINTLRIPRESVSAFEVTGKGNLVDVIAKAYRKAQRGPESEKVKSALADFFRGYGILPITQTGQPFFGERLRMKLSGKGPLRAITDNDAVWLKETWNLIYAFEVFAMAEFSLPRPIMMPLMPLSMPTLRSDDYDLRDTVEVTPTSFPAYINTKQSPEALANYMAAFAEQGRESMLFAPAKGSVEYRTIVTDMTKYERYLRALDLDKEYNSRVPREQKCEFFEQCGEPRKNEYEKIINFYKDSRRCARLYLDKWMMII